MGSMQSVLRAALCPVAGCCLGGRNASSRPYTVPTQARPASDPPWMAACLCACSCSQGVLCFSSLCGSFRSLQFKCLEVTMQNRMLPICIPRLLRRLNWAYVPDPRARANPLATALNLLITTQEVAAAHQGGAAASNYQAAAEEVTYALTANIEDSTEEGAQDQARTRPLSHPAACANDPRCIPGSCQSAYPSLLRQL